MSKIRSFQDMVQDKSRSALGKYKEVSVGEDGLWPLLKYEALLTFLSPIPGLLGLFLRQKAYRLLFRSMGRGVIIGRDVTLRHPGKISVGDGSMIDDGCAVTVRGDDNRIRIGKGVLIGRRSEVLTRHGSVDLDDFADIGSHCRLTSPGRLKIGKHVLIASFCYIGGVNHRIDRTDIPIMYQGDAGKGGVVIEDDVWLGAGVVVNDGVTIGRGAVVGAGSVVTKSLPPYSISFGVPAKVVRYRTADVPVEANVHL